MAGGVDMDSVLSESPILVYVNVDDAGEITEGIAGRRVIPSKQYERFFVMNDEGVLHDLGDYKITNDKLIKK